jgi:hypothetical protein
MTSPKNQYALNSAWVVTLGLVFFFSTVFAVWQFQRPYQWHDSYSISSWLGHPLEWNIDAGLPEITGNINTIITSSNGSNVWIAGDCGLLALSTDGGASWIRLAYNMGNFGPDSGQSVPCASPPAQQKVVIDGNQGTFTPPCSLPFNGVRNPASDDHCGIQGGSKDPAKQLESLAKNNFCATGQPLQTVTYDDLIKLQTESAQIPKNIPDRSVLANQRGGTLGEGKYASYVAFIKEAHYSDVAGGEAVNCNIGGTSTNDIHIVLVQNPADDECKSTTAEMSPHYRPPSWTPDNLNIVHNPVRIQGHVFYDGSHVPCTVTSSPNPKRASLWEIHPVYALDVCRMSSLDLCRNSNTDADWVPLDQWVSSGASNIPPGTVTGESSGNLPLSTAPNLRGLQMDGGGVSGSVIGENSIFTTTDGGRSWSGGLKSVSSLASHRPSMFGAPILVDDFKLNSSFLQADGMQGWFAGSAGTIFRTRDGGKTPIPVTRSALRVRRHQDIANKSLISGSYVRLVAPWYILLLTGCGVTTTLIMRRARTPPPNPEKWTVGPHPVSDKPLEPGEPDALELGQIASGLSYFLSNEKTTPPLVIAVTGRWGSGKSSLMNLLNKQLENYGSHPVWFNAWHHQKEDQLLAALLQTVKVQAVPPLLDYRGIGFRLRLIGKRLGRYWPMLGVALAGCWLIYRAEVYLRNMHPPISIWGLIAYLFHSKGSEGNDASSGGPDTPIIALIAGVAALWNLLSHLLTAFGTSPASLLSSITVGASRNDLEAQTGFRQQFATEFHEVTTSLAKDQRMLILIDDLDRCRPEKVREVLEAVNFLVSSGDCFVVLGMARDVVEQYLNLSFRKVVDSISWEALGLSQQDVRKAVEEMKTNPGLKGSTNDGATISDELAAKRRAYSRLYLEKLIQIEVSVPEATPLQQRILFETAKPRTEQETAKEKKARKRISAFWKIIRIAVPLVQTVVICVAIVGIGLSMRSWCMDRVTEIHKLLFPEKMPSNTSPQEGAPKDSPNKLGIQKQANGSGGQQTNGGNTDGGGAGRGSEGGSSAKLNVPQQQPTQKPDIASSSFSGRSRWLEAWPFGLVSLITLAGLSALLQRLPERDVQDKEEFTDALNEWYPEVLTSGAKNTPRVAKRFQNKVRYLAMRQRAIEQPQPLPLVERLLQRHYGLSDQPVRKLVSLSDALPEAEKKEARTLGNIFIPEPLLVAFAAIEECEPAWMQKESLFKEKATEKFKEKAAKKLQEAERNPGLPACELRKDTGEADSKPLESQKSSGSSSWPEQDLIDYRFAYLKLCSEFTQEPSQGEEAKEKPDDGKQSKATGAGA